MAFFFVMLLLIVLVATFVLAPFARIPVSAAGSQTSPNTTFVSGGTTPAGVTHEWTGPRNQTVVNAALYLAAALYNGPPDGYDTWYHAAMIPAVFSCSECGDWLQGDVQCVALVTAAYALAGQPLPYWRNMNAIDYYTSGDYTHVLGWEVLSPTTIPYPGDMIVLNSPYFGGVGHIVLVVDVKVPGPSGQDGYVQFAEANGPGAIVQMPLVQATNGGFHMGMWSNYVVMGYIRHPGMNNEFLV